MTRAPRSPKVRRAVFALALAACAAAPRPAAAGDLQVSVGLAGAGSDWAGDWAGLGSLRLGYRFVDLVGVYFLGRLGYAAVDDRVLSALSVGAQVWGRLGPARPWLRLGVHHIHEEPWQAIRHQPVGSVLGVGDGIRHRTGLESAAGIDLPVLRRGRFELVTTIEANAAWVTFSSGPSWYFGGGLAFGLNYSL